MRRVTNLTPIGDGIYSHSSKEIFDIKVLNKTYETQWDCTYNRAKNVVLHYHIQDRAKDVVYVAKFFFNFDPELNYCYRIEVIDKSSPDWFEDPGKAHIPFQFKLLNVLQ